VTSSVNLPPPSFAWLYSSEHKTPDAIRARFNLPSDAPVEDGGGVLAVWTGPGAPTRPAFPKVQPLPSSISDEYRRGWEAAREVIAVAPEAAQRAVAIAREDPAPAPREKYRVRVTGWCRVEQEIRDGSESDMREFAHMMQQHQDVTKEGPEWVYEVVPASTPLVTGEFWTPPPPEPEMTDVEAFALLGGLAAKLGDLRISRAVARLRRRT
jgi:hypothetical protein